VFEAFPDAALAERGMECVEHLPDALDDGAFAAEIDGTLPALLAVAEAVVGTERLAHAPAPGDGHGALAGEPLGTGCNQGGGRVIELFNGLLDFHFEARIVLLGVVQRIAGFPF
jgi:hypothetical protein